jgi:hypothetical protein
MERENGTRGTAPDWTDRDRVVVPIEREREREVIGMSRGTSERARKKE